MYKFLLVGFLILGSQAWAALGEGEATCDQDRARLHGIERARSAREGQVTVREFSAKGNSIKQYISPFGAVFAVSWRGISHPDLSILLGSHYSEYRSRLNRQPRPRGRGVVQVQTSKAMVVRAGHMRDVRGFAYVHSLVPNGFKMEGL